MHLDHVVIWVDDPKRSLAFFHEVVGLAPVRAQEFADGKTFFPSVRISDSAIVDLMPRAAAPRVNAIAGAGGSAGHPINHVCIAMTRAEYEALAARLAAANVPTHAMGNNYGALGVAPESFYFRDPDGNVFEARYY